LKNSIGGNCKTVLIANIFPEGKYMEETLSTLRFASRMRNVANECTVNQALDQPLLIKKLEKEIRDLKQELAMHDSLASKGSY
jgi:kinesin family protein 6/9